LPLIAALPALPTLASDSALPTSARQSASSPVRLRYILPLWLRQVSDTLACGSSSRATVAPVAVLHPFRTSAHAEARHP